MPLVILRHFLRRNFMQFTKNDTNIVKGAAILMMMLHHCFLAPERYAGYEIDFGFIGEGYTVLVSAFFKICVAVFVFLSGYGISISLSRIDLNDARQCTDQLKKRMLSLMSGYWFIYVLSVVAVLIIDRGMLSVYKSDYLPDSIIFAVTDFLGLAELFGTPTLNGTWWYMSLAIIIVAVMPIFYALYKKFGAAVPAVITFMLCGIFKDQNFDMVRWLFTMVLGMICAERNLLVKWAEFRIIKKHDWADWIVKFLIYTPIAVLMIHIRQYCDYSVPYLRDGIIPMFFVFYIFAIVSKVPVINKVLAFLGKHSMNIFLSHTFLRAYFLKDFLYSLKYPVVIVTVLTVLSLLLSIVIDLLKKYTGYDKLIKRLTQKITA